MISRVTQVERIYIISYKTFFTKSEKKNLEQTHMCLYFASKLITLVSLFKKSFLLIWFKNNTKTNLYLRKFVKK